MHELILSRIALLLVAIFIFAIGYLFGNMTGYREGAEGKPKRDPRTGRFIKRR